MLLYPLPWYLGSYFITFPPTNLIFFMFSVLHTMYSDSYLSTLDKPQNDSLDLSVVGLYKLCTPVCRQLISFFVTDLGKLCLMQATQAFWLYALGPYLRSRTNPNLHWLWCWLTNFALSVAFVFFCIGLLLFQFSCLKKFSQPCFVLGKVLTSWWAVPGIWLTEFKFTFVSSGWTMFFK